MRGKLTTKTIIISIIALLILCAAITGTVLFLKDSGEAAATGKVENSIGTEKINVTEDNEQLNNDDNTQKVEQNIEDQRDEENENLNKTDNNAIEENNNQTNQAGETIQEEPAPTTIERDTIISETTLGWNNISLNSKIDSNSLEINYNNLEYRVEYYFEGLLNEEASVIIGGNSKGKVIDSYEEKVKVGYKLDRVENLPLTIKENEKENVIKVYYEKDETQTKELKYTVKYYLENEEQEKDKEEVKETVWVNAEETMKFDTTLLNKEYTGYQKVKTDPETVGTTVENGAEIKVYYEKDETQTKELKYTVKYYLENEEQEKDKKEVKETVWVNAEETMEFDTTLLNKEYTGYQKVKTDPETVGTTVENGAEIKVYYEKESYGYTIYYYKDAISGENLLGRIPGIAKFESKITADTTKFIPEEGYVFVGTAPSMTIEIDSTKNILNVVYTRVKTLSYTINYLEKGTTKILKTETVPNQEFNTIITITELEIPNKITVDSKEYVYSNKFTTAQEPPVTGKITIGTNLSLNVINLYYERPELKTEKTSTVSTTAQSGKAYPGDEITYTIKVWNEGSGAKQVKVEDKEPTGTTIVSNSELKNSGNVAVKDGKITWIVNVPENTSKENAKMLTFKVKINEDFTGKITNTAQIDGKNGPSDGNGINVVKPANIVVSKESTVLGNKSVAEKGDQIKYTIKAKNSGDAEGTVVIKDTDLKEAIDNKLVELVDKTGYTGTNQKLINELGENGISLTVKGNTTKKITYTVKVTAGVGTTIKNKVEVVSGGIVDNDKDETTNTIEKNATITELQETIKGKNFIIIMDATESVRNDIETEKAAISDFITSIFPKKNTDTNSTLAVIKYSGDWAYLVGTAGSYDRAQNLKTKVNNVLPGGGSNPAKALSEAYDNYLSDTAENIVIFMGDGIVTQYYYNKVQEIMPKLKQKATIYTIGIDMPTSGIYVDRANSLLKEVIPTKSENFYQSSYTNEAILETMKLLRQDIAKPSYQLKSNNGKVELANTIYADSEHQITIKVNGVVDTILDSLPTDATGKVIKEDGKYYLDLTKFDADANISIAYFTK